jgi:hypothetical protein
MTVVDALRRHGADAAVAMGRVVPGEELLAVGARIFDASESLREIGAAFERLELGFRERIVVRDVGPAVGSGDHLIDLLRMLDARLACSVRVPGAMAHLASVSAMNCSAIRALSSGAIIQPTT